MTELTNLSAKEMKKIRKNFQMLFQDVYSSLDTRMKISKIVTEPLDIHNIGTRKDRICLLYTSPSPRDRSLSRMPSSA